MPGGRGHALPDSLGQEVLLALPARFPPLTLLPNFSREFKSYLGVILIQYKVEINLVAAVGHLDLTGHFQVVVKTGRAKEKALRAFFTSL